MSGWTPLLPRAEIVCDTVGSGGSDAVGEEEETEEEEKMG